MERVGAVPTRAFSRERSRTSFAAPKPTAWPRPACAGHSNAPRAMSRCTRSSSISNFFRDSVSLLVPFYRELTQRYPSSATTAWYHGYVELLDGDIARRERHFDEALVKYAECERWLRRAEALRPDYSESVQRITALARTSRGFCHLRRGQLDTARDLFLAVLGDTPVFSDLPDGLGRRAIDGVSSLGAEYESLSQFARGAELAQLMTAIDPEPGPWWNNLGYFLREYGSQVEGGVVDLGGTPEEDARQIFHESWQAYLRATEFSPSDARIINDTALIQIYHLQDELERAVALEWRAIEIGERQIAEMGPDPDRETWFPVAQAVGDAYQNLGYLAYHVDGDSKKAREFFIKSIETEPERFLDNYLRALDGEGPPVEIRAVSGPSPRRLEDLPPRGNVRWERTWADALARARKREPTDPPLSRRRPRTRSSVPGPVLSPRRPSHSSREKPSASSLTRVATTRSTAARTAAVSRARSTAA